MLNKFIKFIKDPNKKLKKASIPSGTERTIAKSSVSNCIYVMFLQCMAFAIAFYPNSYLFFLFVCIQPSIKTNEKMEKRIKLDTSEDETTVSINKLI